MTTAVNLFSNFFFILALLLVSKVASESGRHVLLFSSVIPPGFELSTTALDPAFVVPFSIALKQQNIQKLTAMFEEISNPLHINYGQYLTHKEIISIVGPGQEASKKINAFLPECFLCASHGDVIKCSAQVDCIERTFETKLVNVKHSSSGLELIRQIGNFSIPCSLSSVIDFVSPFHLYTVPAQRKKIHNPVGAGDQFVAPETLTLVYNITEKGDSRSTQGVAEFGPGNWPYEPSDLLKFAKLTNTVIAPPQFFGPSVNNSGGATDEASLDIQYVGGIGSGNTNWYWEEQTWMYDFVTNLQTQTTRPSVLSLSYAWSEAQQCGSVTDSAVCQQLKLTNNQYVNRINTEFMKVGLLGITILVASGDSGCHGRTDETCAANPWMHPDYPAASPFVTSVGGTEFKNGVSKNTKSPLCAQVPCYTGGEEVAVSYLGSQFASGGGFSTVAGRPSYQSTVVNAYISNPGSKMPPETISWKDGVTIRLYNSSNRGYPDVSALAHNYAVILNGGVGGVSGTSAAAPTWGGIIGLLNAHRIRVGGPLIGFANPLLYTIYAATTGAAFQDITIGENSCTETGCFCRKGFSAAKGWDAVTGLGTPNVGRIVDALDALDAQRAQLIKAARTRR